jgi:hypothetical protein
MARWWIIICRDYRWSCLEICSICNLGQTALKSSSRDLELVNKFSNKDLLHTSANLRFAQKFSWGLEASWLCLKNKKQSGYWQAKRATFNCSFWHRSARSCRDRGQWLHNVHRSGSKPKPERGNKICRKTLDGGHKDTLDCFGTKVRQI